MFLYAITGGSGKIDLSVLLYLFKSIGIITELCDKNQFLFIDFWCLSESGNSVQIMVEEYIMLLTQLLS